MSRNVYNKWLKIRVYNFLRPSADNQELTIMRVEEKERSEYNNLLLLEGIPCMNHTRERMYNNKKNMKIA